MRTLVTGGAGFVGSAVCRRLVELGVRVVNVDKLTYAGNPYSLEVIARHPNYAFERLDICDAAGLEALFARYQPTAVLHLAAESHVIAPLTGHPRSLKPTWSALTACWKRRATTFASCRRICADAFALCKCPPTRSTAPRAGWPLL